MKVNKSLFVISVALSGMSGHLSQAKGQAKAASKTIYVGEISTNGGTGFLPLLDLSDALTKHPHSRLFQVDWDEESGSYSELGTVWYDRLKNPLDGLPSANIFYSRGSVRQQS